MARTYKAILHGDRIEWIDPPPQYEEAATVHITLDETAEAQASRGPAMVEALDALARTGGISSIQDPVSWQREIRQDRTLPRREI